MPIPSKIDFSTIYVDDEGGLHAEATTHLLSRLNSAVSDAYAALAHLTMKQTKQEANSIGRQEEEKLQQI